MSAFDVYVGIDWSGAREAHGVAVAECNPAGRARVIAPPAGGRWTRTGVAAWIAASRPRWGRALVGFDFAFALPFEPGRGYLGGARPDLADASALWEAVEACCPDRDEDLFAGAFVDDSRHAPAYWREGKRPATWRDGPATQRATELAAMASGCGHPVSTLRLAAASKQVGKASLAGMRVLRRLRAEGIAIGPFEEPGASSLVVVEIFPTIFRKLAGHGTRKIDTPAEMHRALAALGARAPRLPARLDDHDADALVTAAGLRRLARRAEVDPWRPASMTPTAARCEGWIFGVAA